MTLRALLFLVAALFVVSLAPDASAQTTTTTTVTLVGTVGRREGREPTGIKPNVISLADCEASDAFQFQIKPITGANLSLEIWGGTVSDCSNKMHSGTLDTDGKCWLIDTISPPPTGTFTVPVREALPHISGASTDTICEDTISTSGSGDVSIFFIPVTGLNGGTAATYAVHFDLQGPEPPSAFSLEIGDGRLIPTWTASSNTDIASYKVYCEQSDSCTSTFLTPGEVPGTDVPDGVKTSTPGPNSTRGEVSGLENGESYVCAMAGVDALGNVGKLTETDCKSPKPVNGYYKSYVAAGGTAGGGFCSFGRAASGAVLAPVLFGALGALIARRKRRGSAR